MPDFERNHHEDEQFVNSPEVAQTVLSILQERVSAGVEGAQVLVSALYDRKGWTQIGPVNNESPYYHESSAAFRLAVEIVLPNYDEGAQKVLAVVRQELAVRGEKRAEDRRREIEAEIDAHKAEAARLAGELEALSR